MKLNLGPGSGAHVVASCAIVLYAQEGGQTVYGTVHPIQRDDDRPSIGAGRPIDRAALLSCLNELAANTAPRAEFLPETVLAVSQSSITWWCRPGLRRVFFDCRELGKRTAIVPHPSLVFHAAPTGFSVFALREDSRPNPDSTLHEPPYFNTWDWGKICIGTAHVPKRIDIASIAGWESGFFESAFTHPNHGGKRINHPKGEFAFWQAMLDGQYADAFPKDLLIPMNKTVGDLIGGKLGA
ncbi:MULTISPECIES: PRTRC system protein B [unclassified Caballeronia]|uniref:PRTRC system protein B n=1 Tax=unclassified Caballeronia TaxID=2646786 RepID=UPI00285A810B|nr:MULTISPECIES: PRTRC system protein B [unclassified Caballeronia]MDR5776914.1 PRTRC system protein B [Caballeronia sp. LZ002]MDR5798779.1 PRTRC system protein B [Caballeronia sp. LZ001]MDR5852301.1 PRTRC system protein B [Caballeronia sp. LZ003]